MSPRAIVASVAMMAGAIVLVRGLWRAMPVQSPSPVESTDTATGAEAAPGVIEQEEWRYTSRELEVSDPFSQPGIRESFRESVRGAALDAGAGNEAIALAEEATAYFTEVLGGSAGTYVRYVTGRGGTTRLTSEDPELRSSAHQYVESVLSAFRGQPLSLRGLQVRSRVRSGHTVPVLDLGGAVKMTTAPDEYPAFRGIVQNTEQGTTIHGETFEVLLPIRHQYEGGDAATVLIGLWLTKSPDDGRWRPSAIAMYGPKRLVPMVTPPL